MGQLSAPNVEKLVVAYLSPHFANVGVRLDGTDQPMPFIKICRVNGPTTDITDYAVVDIEVFDTDRDVAGDTADDMHDLIVKWTPRDTVTYGGKNYGIDKRETLAKPFWLDYQDDNLQRYVGRYRIQLRVK